MQLEDYYNYSVNSKARTIELSLMPDFKEALNACNVKSTHYKEWLPGMPLPNPGITYNGMPITSLKYCFAGLKARSLDLSLWETSNISNMFAVLSLCEDLQAIDLSNWDMSNVNEVSCMFSGDHCLRELTFGKGMPLLRTCDMQNMLRDCINIEVIDISNLCVSKEVDAKNFEEMDRLRFLFVKNEDERDCYSTFVPAACKIVIA